MSQKQPPDAPQENAHQLVSEMVANELRAQETDHSLWRYRQIMRQGSGSEEVEFVQTPIGSIHHVLQRDGRTLDGDEMKKENSRVLQVAAHPDEIRKQEKEAQKDGKEEADLLKLLPDALEFKYAGRNGGVVTLEFTPNPSFKPHHHEEEVFHHMSGRVQIDASHKRLLEINGRLNSEVKFGGGILGHLDKGGTFIVNQRDVGGGHWEMTRLFINMNGKALFFKTINVHHDEQDSDFRPVQANITPHQAAELLNQGAPPASGSAQGSSEEGVR